MPDNNFFINRYKKNSSGKNSGKNEKLNFEKLEEKAVKTGQPEEFVSRKKLAAMFLILIGPEKAREIVKSFNEEELVKITNEIINIENITQEDVRAVEAGFGKIKTDDINKLKGGKEFARTLLQNAFGIEKGGNFFIKTLEEAKESELAFLDKLPEEEIGNILSEESDLIISVILSKLEPKKSARILSLLSRDMTIKVIKKMSGKLEIARDIYEIVLKKLKQKASEIKEDDTIKISGKTKLVEILKYSDNAQSEKIIGDIETENPELANEIKESIFTFSDVISLRKRDLEKALKNYPDKELAFILKGTKDEIKTVFFTCISKRRRELIEDEISILGAVKKTDVDDKRKNFINYLKDLEQKGKIVLKPDKDVYVD